MLVKQVVGSGKDVLIAQNFNFTDCALNSDFDQTLHLILILIFEHDKPKITNYINLFTQLY